MKKIAVIGAGIAGVTAAYYLVRKGFDVTVYDEERYPAMKTSYANGGQVSVSNSEVWTTWSNVYKGIKWMLKKDAPLLIRPSLDLDKAVWLAKFLYHTANNDYAKNTAKTIQLGIESRRLYEDLIQQEHISFDDTKCGILHIYKDQKYFDAAIAAKKIYNDNGCEWDPMTPDQVKQKDPALNSVKDIVGGIWTAGDWTGDIHKFSVALAGILSTRYNVRFVTEQKILDLDKDLKDYDDIVVAAGIGSVKLAKTIDEHLPIYPVKGYSITINLDKYNEEFAPRVSLLDDAAKIVTSKLGDRLRVAGTAELAGENYDIRRDRIEPLLKWVHDNFPGVNTSNYSSWACLRPMTPNMMPIVQQSTKRSNVWYHTGHGHLGWTLSPSTANSLAELISEN